MSASDVKRIERECFPKWISGWHDGGGECMNSTVARAWMYGRDKKPSGCSWYTYGYLMAREQNIGRTIQLEHDRIALRRAGR